MISRDSIDDLAILLRQAYHIPTPITDVEQVIRDMNGKIIVKADLDMLCEGNVAKNGDSFIIAINPDPNELESQRRFTLMRALGHVFLHMGYRMNPNLWGKFKDNEFLRFNSMVSEYEANEFALDLMMPKGAYLKCIDELKSGERRDFKDLARHFGVTFEDALQRGRRLGVIE